MLDGNRGVTTVRNDDGELEAPRRAETAKSATVAATLPLGQGTAARVIGTTGNVACVRIEHTTQEPGNGAGLASSAKRPASTCT